MITTHALQADAFIELAGGAGSSTVVGRLREAQHSKHLMLLHVVAEAAEAEPSSPAATAFHAAYQLLAAVQAVDPETVATLFGLPHIGSWAHDCLACLDNGSTPDWGYLAAAAAAAGVRTGVPFELSVPVRDGWVLLPGLGGLEASGDAEWVRLASDGGRLRVGEHVDVACADLVPDDGSGRTVPHWRGTPLVRATAGGETWEVLLETSDRCLDRYTLPMLTDMSAAEVTRWRRLIQATWELLVGHHGSAAGPVAVGVTVIVPLVPRSDLESATYPAAFGAVATSLPPTPVSMAETLIHEFQHIKLGGLMDMLPLIEPTTERGFAPWREDPRPLGGIVQGLYAFTGVVRFWDVQRHLETDPDEMFRASVQYERWRLAIEHVADSLISKECLTPTGARFISMLRQQGPRGEAVTADAAEIAREVDLDNWLTWQLTHTAVDAVGVANLAEVYQHGEPPGGRPLPEVWIENDIRKIDSIPRSRLLSMRYREPRRYRQLSATDLRQLSAADALLVHGDADAAVAAYRAQLAVEPDPAAWIGLALAIHRLQATSSQRVLAKSLPLLFEVHACLARRGVRSDPLDLAAWFE